MSALPSHPTPPTAQLTAANDAAEARLEPMAPDAVVAVLAIDQRC